ncbi:SUMO1 sentrin specific peptidase 8, partial [Homalodisca vitripennis]
LEGVKNPQKRLWNLSIVNGSLYKMADTALKNASPSLKPNTTPLEKIKEKSTVDVDIQTLCTSGTDKECQTDTNLRDLVTASELLGPNWICDETINKYISLINEEILRNEQTTVLNPLIIQAVKQVDEYKEYLDPFNIKRYNFLFMPINDSRQMLAGGGSHWTSKILKYITGISENLAVEKVKGPQQNNAIDCGIFMLLAIEQLVAGYLAKKELNLSSLVYKKITNKEIIQKRAMLAYILNNRYKMNDELLSLLVAPEKNEMQNCITEVKQNSHLNEGIEKKISKKNFDRTNHEEVQAGPVKEPRSRITVFGDSHAKNCVPLLEKMFSHREALVSGNVYPVAPLSHVFKNIEDTISHQNYSKNDVIVIVGGTNSIDNEEKKIEQLLISLLKKTSETNVVLTTIPHRYDQPQINQKIQNENKKIYKIAENQKISFIPINILLTREQYTKHGLHLNKQGKDVLCITIALHASIALSSTVTKKTCDKISTTQPDLNLTLDSTSQQNNKLNLTFDTCDKNRQFKGFTTPSTGKLKVFQSFIKETEEQPISVDEIKMTTVFKEFHNDDFIAFAHSISADLESDRNMTAGVAVAFREEFGRPKRTDVISNHLAYQKALGGASVYSLITKLKYNDKPTTLDYDLAFEQLMEDFKRRGLKKLVCSAIGCVRDLISPNQFISNLTKFQHATGATIKIVTYPQYTKRTLWNGLSHHSFVGHLKNIILVQHLQNTSPVSDQDRTLIPASPALIDDSLDSEPISHPHSEEQTSTNQQDTAFLRDLSLFPPL